MENPALFDLYRNRYNQEDFFTSFYRASGLRNGYDGRYGSERFHFLKSWRRPEDEQMLFGYQEVSNMG